MLLSDGKQNKLQFNVRILLSGLVSVFDIITLKIVDCALSVAQIKSAHSDFNLFGQDS